jgi:hypothetical protein
MPCILPPALCLATPPVCADNLNAGVRTQQQRSFNSPAADARSAMGVLFAI